MMAGKPWTAHQDDEGQTYYYDGVNTSWEKPHWTAYRDDNGDVYYCHETSGESVWEVPNEDYLDVGEEVDDASDEVINDTTDDAKNNEDDDADRDAVNATGKGEKIDTEQQETTSREEDEAIVKLSDKDEQDEKEQSDGQSVVDGPSSPPSQNASPMGSGPDDDDEEMFGQSPPTTPTKDKNTFDWSAFRDDNGQIYYYNEKTGESAWDPPTDGFNPPPPPVVPTKWVEYTDENGQTYYYNEETNETQWEMPEGFQSSLSNAPTATTTDRAEIMDTESTTAEPSSNTHPLEATTTTAAVADDIDVEKEQPAVEKSPEIDPAVRRLQTAESMLGRLDSVLEPDCKSHADVVVAANDGDPQKAMAALITNYRGQPAICGLLGKWLTDLKRPADTIRDVCREVIVKTVKDSFSKDMADEILNLSKSEAAFLGGMMDSSEWRKVLIDLTIKHKDSAVLLYCLRDISKRGHHREIAKVINQSEHFAVFNAMLASELSVVGSQAVSAGSDLNSAIHLRSLVADLCRSCTSTAYTYMYSIALITSLDHMARQAIAETESSEGERDERFRQAAEKWRALAEELEGGMTDPNQAQSSNSSSHLLRKRRLDVALSFGELREKPKKQQRKQDQSESETDLNVALASLISRYSMGIQLEETMLDSLLPQGLNVDTRGVGELMNRYPLSIKALLGQLYKPGSTRLSSPSMKSKCARLIALATEAATQSAFEFESAKKGSTSEEGELASDELGELSLTRMIVDGSKYCEELETTVAFHVYSGSTTGLIKGNLSTGQKLYELSLKCAPVALGVMMWAKEHTRGREFSSSASFPTVSSSILSLIRLIAIRRPPTRRDALDIAVTFLEHSNPDISYKTISSIRENALRLMVVLLTKGEVVAVLDTMTKRLENRSRSDIDASLIRYFVFGIVDVVKGPLSPVMVCLLIKLLAVSKVLDALRSSYVTKENMQRLRTFILLFPATMKRCSEKEIFLDDKQFSSLAKLYGVSE